MPLEEAETFISDRVGKTVHDIGYGHEVPHAFSGFPEYVLEQH